MGTNHVQEVTVVRNDNHGAFTRIQCLFQPTNGIDIQVVGRFVEQQNIRIREQCLRQQHTQFPAWRHFTHQTVVLFYRNTYTQQQLTSTRFSSVAIIFSYFGFQLCGVHVVFIGRFRISIDAVAFMNGRPQLGVAHHDHIQYAFIFIRELILTQLTYTLIRIKRHVAGGRFQIATHDFHERRFTATICPNQTITIATAKFDRNVFKQWLRAKLHGDIVGA